ncbi:prepilin-type N-terminal cleavage/methylation domain-containing protein, partial [Stenotrophomonas sp. HMWF003]|uniref:PilW family protein n=1 Tax=Stenotrophomonas sp. HMWF003 TaxID=2056840 RepID=UPI002159EBA4
MSPSSMIRMRQAGLSLVELMIAMVIGLLLMLGVIQVFIASQAASRLSEGVARVQENGRFALDFLERDVRMAGHMGCVNDQGHIVRELGSPRISTGATPGNGSPLDFNVSVQGYEAPGTAPGNTLVAGGGSIPANLPAAIAALAPAPMPGSDILVLR